MALFPSTSIASAAGGYDIDNSCRLDRASSSKFTRATWTSSAADRRKWTYSVWFKIGDNFSTARDFFFCGTHDECMLSNSPANTIDWFTENTTGRYITNRVIRDVGAWYHAVFVMDTTLAAAGDRMKLYVNGVRETSFSTSNNPTQNHQTKFGDGSSPLYLGSSGSSNYWDGYFAEAHFVQGQALDANSFGEVDADYGHWKAKEYSGSHGDGFYLDFKSSGTLGNDAAGGTDLTPSNLAASDQMLDSPTNNFSVISNLDGDIDGSDVFAEGNLSFKNTANGLMSMRRSTFAMEYGKWYWEVYRKDTPGEQGVNIGIMPTPSGNNNSTDIGSTTTSSAFGLNKGIGFKGNSAVHAGSGNTINGTVPAQAQGDIIQFAYDAATGYFWVGFNGTWRNSGNPAGGATPWAVVGTTNLANITYTPAWNSWNNVHWIVNFGQDSTFAGNIAGGSNTDDNEYGNFKYDVPAGFLAMCSKNLSDPAVKPGEHFNIILYDDGAGAKTGVGFQPDLVWLKASGITSNHHLTDAVRGVTKSLSTNLGDSAAEATDSAGLTAFGSDGFTVGTDNHYDDTTGAGMVAWCWKANGSGSANEAGSINTTATSANTSAGFSISTFVGNSTAGATVGHGLSVAPNLVILREQNHTGVWGVGSVQSIASLDFTDVLTLNASSALFDHVSRWNDTAPTSTLVTLGNNEYANESGRTYIMYCFHNVEGYSKVGAYTGNGNVDGSFIYTGFKPRWVMCKRVNGTGAWNIYDTTRANNNNNPVRERLPANLSYAAEPSSFAIDVLSNGFKQYNTDNEMNANTNYYLFLAFAETPFKYTTAF